MPEVDRNSRDKQGLSPAMHALYRGEAAEAETLLPDEPNVFEAAAFGREERLEELLEGDPGLARAFSVDGFTALHLAAFFGRAEAVRLLLDAGADPNAVGTSEQIGPVQPLHSAAASGRLEGVRLLLERGADVNARQGGGFTALHAAAASRDMELARVLLAAGADMTVKTDEGREPDLDFLR
jgi:ankyrin repeat protein